MLYLPHYYYFFYRKMNIQNSQLYQLFNSLSDKEIKEMGKVIISPFFNYRNEEIRLFEYLKKQRKAEHPNFSVEKVILFVFGKEESLPNLRHVMTYLARIIIRFIAISEMEANRSLQSVLLISAYRKRGLEKQFLSTYQEAETFFISEAALQAELYFYRLQLHLEFYNHSVSNRKAANQDLVRLSEDLDTFYIIQKLKQSCNILSYQNIFNFNHQPKLINEVLEMAQQNIHKENLLLKLLYYNYLCLCKPDNKSYFFELKKVLLNKYTTRIQQQELRDNYTLAINYCIKKLNTGAKEYYQEVFEIYQSGLLNQVFEENGILSPFTYKNIVSIAIGLKEYKWVKAFIESYKHKLDNEVQTGFYTYCLARYYFGIEDYERVSDLLREVEIKEQFTDLDARVLLAKTYFELDEINLLDYCINNLKQQLKRKKLQTYHAAVYGNFVKMLSKIVHLRPYDKKARQALREKILDTKVIAEKDWLLLKFL